MATTLSAIGLATATALVTVAATAPAEAAIIGFDPLGGLNLAPYTGHVEDGFTISTLNGAWQQGQIFGDPTPSILGGPIGVPEPGVLSIIFNGNRNFFFRSVELSSNNTAGSQYRFQGFFKGSSAFDSIGSIGIKNQFQRFDNAASGIAIDELRISVTPGLNVSSFNVDNIDVAPIPTPALLPGLIGMGVAALRKRQEQDDNARNNGSY
ncbi:MAG: PTPA-CTERM sorting domain-containing protein [Leptolyngbyaceae cyanobacterium SM2_5_2]|nr:PTPA-CTERM sorting domain-containing protein [Leptolyngbyaceae cyanobacterium SM2_5_2]